MIQALPLSSLRPWWWTASSLISLLNWQLTEERLASWSWNTKLLEEEQQDHRLISLCHVPICNPHPDLYPVSNQCVYSFASPIKHIHSPLCISFFFFCGFSFAYSVFHLFSQLQVFLSVSFHSHWIIRVRLFHHWVQLCLKYVFWTGSTKEFLHWFLTCFYLCLPWRPWKELNSLSLRFYISKTSR